MWSQQSWLRPSCANVVNFDGFTSQQGQSKSASENLTATLAERAIDLIPFLGRLLTTAGLRKSTSGNVASKSLMRAIFAL
jgi:hypothetical protein